MFELKRKKSDYGPDLLDDCSVASSGNQQDDVYLDSIAHLKQKVFQLEQQLVQAQHLAYHDELTGLPNRCLLRDRLDQAINQAARHQNQMGLLFLDLNCFKFVNDTHGHSIGDALIRQGAKRLVSGIRAADSAYRYGGDEFVILLPEVDGTRGSTELMRKLHAHLAEPFSIDHHSLVVTASIGIAVYPTDGATYHDLLGRADSSMYQAKTDSNSLSRGNLSKGNAASGFIFRRKKRKKRAE